MLCSASVLAQSDRCKGVKHWYAGKCRYADEIARLKAAKRARQQAAEQRRQQEEEQRQAELAAERDRGACELARVNDTLEGWRAYLNATPEGMCSAEARERVAALEKLEEERRAEKERQKRAQKRAQKEAQERALAEQRRRARREAQAELAQAKVAQGELVQPPASEDDIRPFTAMMVTGFSTAGAAAIAAAVAGGIAIKRRADINDLCPNDVCTAEHETLVSDARQAAHVTTGALVVLGVGAAVGVIGLLLDNSPVTPEVDAGMLTWRY